VRQILGSEGSSASFVDVAAMLARAYQDLTFSRRFGELERA
jgi:hypothetical protein